MNQSDLPGLDLARLKAHLDEHRPGLTQGELSGQVVEEAGPTSPTSWATAGPGGWSAARRWATSCRPRTTWAASTG